MNTVSNLANYQINKGVRLKAVWKIFEVKPLSVIS
jgi:hypothetical protein